MIKHRWGAIDDEQRQGIRNYVSNLIIKISSDEASFRAQKVFLNKLNIILVEVRALPPMPILAPLAVLRLSCEGSTGAAACRLLNNPC